MLAVRKQSFLVSLDSTWPPSDKGLLFCNVCLFVSCCTATMVLTLANLEGEESFDSSMLGQADEVVQERVCDDELIVIKR